MRGQYASAGTGVFHATAKGFGFITPDTEDGGTEDLFVPARYVGGAWAGDRVQYLNYGADPFRGPSAKPEAHVTKIMERGVTELVGTVLPYGRRFRLLPDRSGLPVMTLDPGSLSHLVNGDKVKARITNYSTPDWYDGPFCSSRNGSGWAHGEDRFEDEPEGPACEAVKFLGHTGDPGLDILCVAEEAGISNEFPVEVLKEARALPQSVSAADCKGRQDFRDWYTVTIDGDNTKDFDDAVSIKADAHGYTLGVHIADVSHYVTEGSALDKEALKRGTSTYLPDRTIPMLPVELCNGICSLNPGVDRLTLSCVMTYNKEGKRLSADVTEGVIRSNERMTYRNVTRLLEGKEENDPDLVALKERYAEGLPAFRQMESLYRLLEQKRKNRGMISFTLPEPEITLDEKGHVKDIEPHRQDLAMKMVEQFMLEANEAAAEMFCKAKIPFEYRIHDVPPADKLLKAQEALSNLGVALNVAGKQVTPHEVAQAVEQAENLHVEEGAGMIIVRSMARAAYSTECRGHFGLAAKYYCHFTSPIRRYPDTQIHRIIHEYLDDTLTDERKAHYRAVLPGVSALNSKAERKSATAELAADKIKVCEWLADHVGEVFDATVSGVTKKGVFATIRGVMEGMIPMRAFGDSMMSDENGFSATDEWSGRRIYVGLPVRIRVRAADPAKKQADFDLLGFPAA